MHDSDVYSGSGLAGGQLPCPLGPSLGTADGAPACPRPLRLLLWVGGCLWSRGRPSLLHVGSLDRWQQGLQVLMGKAVPPASWARLTQW